MNTTSDGRTLILLVEDNDSIRGAFGVLLEEYGYRVEEAATGAEALEKAAASNPSIILMDLGLPDLHGLEVTRRLKADPRTRESAVIALTGRALETDAAACMEAGCVAYLAKPVNADQLLGLIREVLED